MPEGALRIVDGKARLVKESYCDGLSACINSCPKGALVIEEREAEPFDEEAVKLKMAHQDHHHEPVGWEIARRSSDEAQSKLTNWPIKLELVNPSAPFLKNSRLLIG